MSARERRIKLIDWLYGQSLSHTTMEVARRSGVYDGLSDSYYKARMDLLHLLDAGVVLRVEARPARWQASR